jgi:hypothetical protein
VAAKNLPTRGYAFSGTIALVVTRGYAIGIVAVVPKIDVDLSDTAATTLVLSDTAVTELVLADKTRD